jgi:hypothetical protein
MAIRITRNQSHHSHVHSHVKHKKNFKKKSDEELLLLVKERLESGTKNELLLHEATLALSELSIRPIAKEYKRQFRILAHKLSAKTESCFIDLFYSIEIAGIKKSCFDSEADSSELIHPYPRADIMKKIRMAWEQSHASELSLDGYICTHLSKKEKRQIEKVAIKYLRDEERSKYLVTFEDGNVLIGGNSVVDRNYIFVVTADGKEMYAGCKKKGDFQHTSFFEAEPVLCAGRFTVVNGKIALVQLNSGHYKPTMQHGESLRAFLSHKSRLGKGAEALSINGFVEE